MGLAIARKDTLSPVQVLVKDALERLEADYEKRGERLVMRRLELANGISNGTIGQLLKGQRQGVSEATAKRIEKLLGIPWRPLVWTGKPSKDPVEQSATPPPATTVRLTVVNDEHRKALSDVFDGSAHRLEDADAVREVLARGAALIEDESQARALLRAWLDSAARLRERGHEATPEAIFADVTLVSLERMARLNEAARAESAGRGYEPPTEVPSAVRKLAKNKPSRELGRTPVVRLNLGDVLYVATWRPTLSKRCQLSSLMRF